MLLICIYLKKSLITVLWKNGAMYSNSKEMRIEITFQQHKQHKPHRPFGTSRHLFSWVTFDLCLITFLGLLALPALLLDIALDGSEGEWVWAPRFRLFPADLPLVPLLHGCLLTQLHQEGWLLCVLNAVLTLETYLGNECFNEARVPRESSRKSHFFSINQRLPIPPRKVLLTL